MSNNAREDAGTRLDAAIDRAVRELMDGEPRGDLRARVLDAIERPRRRFSWTWVLAPATAAALIVMALVLTRPTPRAERPRTGTDVVLRAPESPSQVPDVARRQEPHGPPRVRIAPRGERQARAAAVMADTTIFNSARPEGFAVVAALAPPPPLRVDTIADPGSSAPPTLNIAPLQVAPLELNALTDTPRERQE